MEHLEYPELVAICSCESNGCAKEGPRHFNGDGSVLLGKYTPIEYGYDVGACQINTRAWLDTAQKLGYDIYTPHGNVEMAKYIFETEGTWPWKASKHMWSKLVYNF